MDVFQLEGKWEREFIEARRDQCNKVVNGTTVFMDYTDSRCVSRIIKGVISFAGVFDVNLYPIVIWEDMSWSWFEDVADELMLTNATE